jgi:TPR repeat protein
VPWCKKALHYLNLAAEQGSAEAQFHLGKAVQVDPIKPTLKAPGTKRLKPKYDQPLSSIAFNFNLRRYTWARCTSAASPSPATTPR